jgi:hypothetical protein
MGRRQEKMGAGKSEVERLQPSVQQREARSAQELELRRQLHDQDLSQETKGMTAKVRGTVGGRELSPKAIMPKTIIPKTIIRQKLE